MNGDCGFDCVAVEWDFYLRVNRGGEIVAVLVCCVVSWWGEAVAGKRVREQIGHGGVSPVLPYGGK